MDFFGNQNSTSRTSLVIAASFGLSMIVVAVLIQIVVGGLSTLIGTADSVFELNGAALGLTAAIWATIVFGAVFSWKDVRAGGAVVARSLGAIQASSRSRHEAEKTLLKVVSEVAIASQCARPEVFVLREERSINSFVVGSVSGDNAIVVTQGALENLDTEELGGIISHEFAHIANVDVPTNMRLMAALGGLLALEEVGKLLSGKAGKGNPVHPYKLAGLALRMLGIVGVVIG